MVKLKDGYRLRDGDQIPTRPTTILAIMLQPTFSLGVADGRAGRAYHRDYDLWHTNDQWGYERGRQWASVAPRRVPFKRDGDVNPEAVRYWRDII